MQIRRAAAVTAAVTVAATSLVACSSNTDDDKTITVGTTDDAKQAWVAFEQEAKNAGYDIDIKSFSDYNTPNQALDQGELDTNNFQHLKFLAEYNHGNGTNLVPIVATEIVPLALFWKGHDSLDGIEGEEVAIPNDSTNQGRAINVLVQAGLITLKKNGIITPTPLDIDEKKSKVKVVPVDAAQTPSAHGEGTPAIINNSFLERAGIDPATAVFQDDPNSAEAEPYINVFAVREEDADNEDIKKLAELWHSDAVQKGVDEDSAGTSVQVKRTPEELKEILDKLEADLD
ncbi:methionine ABC transporter substrate-binding protein [Corynebacterium macginleyi]|uniref:Methionine ABC transporter substrate-binding protein n=1 Tax=Corynebacterium macginleyi TaxID=38290 RepID=A0A3M0GEE6_9CORY|nr:MetQ/NlpA family ABC transporter substrate-binding protein [Corynebacterium macginleyi]MBK4140772.1 methionine ABC transporter substrate-binding protein [Corynebacterium macginleyi]MBK4157825.1 methionine ABC transporter substrate-binding protein [Corynebacterium macginleyi]QRJ58316.1 methionine ABC transporter substrate-binding protein [Corynebacterium macginleyi]RMB63110.1 methionine ABC transporter substrate-binding protein [Corynebacterium macginleyi]